MKQGLEQTPKEPSGVSNKNPVWIFKSDGKKSFSENFILSFKSTLYIKLLRS
jgi:hypothetical protein